MASIYTPPGSETITLRARREGANGTARFSVQIGSVRAPSLSTDNLNWQEAYIILARYGAGIHAEVMLRSALAEFDGTGE